MIRKCPTEYEIRCDICGVTTQRVYGNRESCYAALRRAGWRIGENGHRCTCPECAEKYEIGSTKSDVFIKYSRRWHKKGAERMKEQKSIDFD